jgi:hypothetical protein
LAAVGVRTGTTLFLETREGDQVIGIFATSICTAATATEMLSKYQGTSSINNCDVPQRESDVSEFPLLIVTRRGYERHEVVYSLNSISKRNATDVETLSFSWASEGEASTFNETWSLKQRQIGIWGWNLSETILVRKGGKYGGGNYKKCALSATPRKQN